MIIENEDKTNEQEVFKNLPKKTMNTEEEFEKLFSEEYLLHIAQNFKLLIDRFVSVNHQKLDSAEAILRKKLFAGFSEHALRVRRNLLTVTMIALIYHYSGIGKVGINFIITIEEIEPIFIKRVLACVVSYHLIYFVTISAEVMQTWDFKFLGAKKINEARKQYNDDNANTLEKNTNDVEADIEASYQKTNKISIGRFAFIEFLLPLFLGVWALHLLLPVILGG